MRSSTNRAAVSLAVLVSSVLALGCAAPAQADGGAPTRKTGTIFKHEIDNLIRLIRARAADGPLGGESVEATGKILTAMGHCHRRYHKGDGPVVRPSIEFLIRSRQQDGSFGDVGATVWASAALSTMDPDAFPDEVRQARGWLARHADEVAARGVKGFDERVAALLDTVRADVFPQHLAATVAEQVDGWLTSGQIPGLSPAGDALVELVAAQFANRQLDRRSDPAGAGVAVFTATQQRAFDWLLAQQKDGVFSVNFGGQMYPDPSLTGFGLLALQTKPRAMRSDGEQNVIESGLRWLLAQQRDDGTFGEDMANYTTCVAVAALSRWDDPAVAPAMQKAQKAILAFQHLESTGFRRGDRDYGSIGYGDSQRGDLSNLHFSIGALRATGLPADDEALQKAIVFLQRTQNLKSVNDFKGRIPDPSNDSELVTAVSGNDGGATYYPGDSNAGYDVQPDGSVVARSYGSMTYALLKAYTLLGLSGSDPRVQAAVDWIRDHWSLETNPGADPSLGEKAKYQGVFYGYMVLAQALAAAGIDELEVAQEGGAQKEVGQKAAAGDADAAAATARIDWRHALRQHLERTQQQDGTWVNDKNGRWMEDRPLLCTCYALVALELCNGHGR